MVTSYYFSFWLLTVFAIGANVICLTDRDVKITGLEFLGLSFLIGIPALSIQFFLAGIAGVHFSRLIAALPWGMVTLYTLVAVRPWQEKRFSFGLRRMNLFEKGLSGLIGFELIYTFFRATIKPFESYDAVAIHALKGKMLYFLGTIPRDFFKTLGDHFQGVHPDYPLFLSLAETSVYTFIGSFNERMAGAVLPLLLAAFIAVFYTALKNEGLPRIEALLAVFILVSVPQFNAYATNGYTDLPCGIFFFCAVAYAYKAFTRGNSLFFFLSFVFMLFCLWTKKEGQALACIVVLTMAVYGIRHRRLPVSRAFISRGGAVVMIFLCLGIGMFFKATAGLTNENFNIAMIHPDAIRAGLEKIPPILYEYQKHLFGFKKWNLVWILALIVLCADPRETVRAMRGYILFSIALFFLFYTGMYMFSAVDIHFLLRTTGARLLLHILPVVVFLTALGLRKYRIAGRVRG
ncbi:MAG: hypothetical protein PHS37_01755 [Candidatus Omnitrophica bacterium]|nr:hypothetical protein [Candidatus Omnitrophota bacterium]